MIHGALIGIKREPQKESQREALFLISQRDVWPVGVGVGDIAYL